jgi:hypothetical protein
MKNLILISLFALITVFACKKETTIEYVNPVFKDCKTLNDSIKGTYATYSESQRVLKFDSIGNIINIGASSPNSMSMGDSIAIYSIKGHSANFTLTITWYISDLSGKTILNVKWAEIYNKCQLTDKGNIISMGNTANTNVIPTFIRL